MDDKLKVALCKEIINDAFAYGLDSAEAAGAGIQGEWRKWLTKS